MRIITQILLSILLFPFIVCGAILGGLVIFLHGFVEIIVECFCNIWEE